LSDVQVTWCCDDLAKMIFFTVTIEVAAAGENDEEKKTEVKEGDESKLEEVDKDGLRRG